MSVHSLDERRKMSHFGEMVGETLVNARRLEAAGRLTTHQLGHRRNMQAIGAELSYFAWEKPTTPGASLGREWVTKSGIKLWASHFTMNLMPQPEAGLTENVIRSFYRRVIMQPRPDFPLVGVSGTADILLPTSMDDIPDDEQALRYVVDDERLKKGATSTFGDFVIIERVVGDGTTLLRTMRRGGWTPHAEEALPLAENAPKNEHDADLIELAPFIVARWVLSRQLPGAAGPDNSPKSA